MNSIIEAQDEFLQWIFFPQIIEPDMPVVQMVHEGNGHFQNRVNAWEKRNHASIHRNLGEFWDRKLANEHPNSEKRLDLQNLTYRTLKNLPLWNTLEE